MSTQLNHLASLAKLVRVCLWTKRLWFRVTLQSSRISDVAPLLSNELLNIQAITKCRFTVNSYEIWKRNTFNAPYRKVLATQLNHLVTLAKWMSVHLRTNRLWVRVSLQSVELLSFDVALASSKKFIDIQAITECRFTLKAYMTW